MAGNSESNKKSAQTKKELYGEDYWKGVGARGGKHRTRGYFGRLKDEGRSDELREISRSGAIKTNEQRAAKRKQVEKGAKESRQLPNDARNSRSAGAS